MTVAEYDLVRGELCRWCESVREFDFVEIPRLDNRSTAARIAVILDLLQSRWIRPTWREGKSHAYEPSVVAMPRRCVVELMQIASGTKEVDHA
jgi:hypothetical protein